MKTYKLKDIISQGTKDLFYIWWQELKAVVKDQGVLIFFILVPLGYPLLYTFIYTNETVREVPAAVVDNNRSSLSREYLRLVDAGADLEIVSHCSDMEAGKTVLRIENGNILIRYGRRAHFILSDGCVAGAFYLYLFVHYQRGIGVGCQHGFVV